MMTSLLAAVNVHTEAIQKRPVPCTFEACPRCQAKPPKFKRHDDRERTLLLFISGLVQRVVTLLIRWKCPCCDGTFTDYPEFILPFKRYAFPLVMLGIGHYVNDDQATYCQAAQVEKGPLFYAAKSPGVPNDKELTPSTIHRWVSWLGGLSQTLQEALSLIRARAPDLDLHRQVHPSPLRKYRSESRRQLLQVAWHLHLVDRIYRGVMGMGIFPHLAMSCR